MSSDSAKGTQTRSPLDLTPEEMLAADRLTSERLARFFHDYPGLAPMGTAHDPRRNSTRSDLELGYQASAAPPEGPLAVESEDSTGPSGPGDETVPAANSATVLERSLTVALDIVLDRLAPLSQLPGHPGFMAYVAGAGNHLSSIAQQIAMDLNPFSGHTMMAPGLIALEHEALGWFKTILGFPQSSAGFFTSGSSLATLSALVTARTTRFGSDFSRGVIYASDQAHHCIRKAARLAGFDPERVRAIKSKPRTFRIDLPTLKEQIATDRQAGLTPFFLVGNAGTTNTGAIDDLKALREIADRENLWFHADGAYGALFNVTEEGRARLQGLDSADSICFDPHKSFGLPYGTGALLVREGERLRQAHSGETSRPATHASYMPPEPETPAALADFADLSPELSRDFRGLRVWLPIKVLGLKPFRDNLEEKLALARLVADELRATPGLELRAETMLSIVAFGVNAAAKAADNNRLTAELLARVNERGRVFLSGCELKGKKAVRICLLSFRAHEAEARLAISEIRTALEQILIEHPQL